MKYIAVAPQLAPDEVQQIQSALDALNGAVPGTIVPVSNKVAKLMRIGAIQFIEAPTQTRRKA